MQGTLRDKIDIYDEIRVGNATGEEEKSYQYSFSLRSQTSFMGGDRNLVGQMEGYGRVMKFKVHHSFTRYNERQVIQWRGDFYKIQSIDPDRSRQFNILSAERVPAGTLNIIELIGTVENETIINDYDKIVNS